jgi:predicted cupin superfamily sugar epimerase
MIGGGCVDAPSLRWLSWGGVMVSVSEGRLMLTAEEVIRRLQLVPHPCEGGFFRETYRAQLTIPASALSNDYSGDRRASTAIYFLLTADTFSEMHRLPTDEIFHFYLGDSVEMLQLHPGEKGEIIRLGADLTAGEQPQVLAPGGTWQGSRLAPGGSWALLGTTVAPGFEFADYTSGRRHELIAMYPEFAEMIAALTRE